MPETALARYEARQAERDRVIAEALAEARKRAAVLMKSNICRVDDHSACPGIRENGADCLCTCHDPAITYWVEWYAYPRDGLLAPGSMVSGHYGTLDEAIDDGFAAKPAEAAWIRDNWDLSLVEQVTEERWDALGDYWDAKAEAEKAALRPSREEAGRG